ncbi:DeoR faimly transcriptional regulator [Thioclava dalianensis]|uniref:DeoR faimly transcriptional regulator n=1 Tax=Thioclava dalianensis TaxID=1185766 RepID=A0A074T7W5_9RHOB|nr:DeoR/GlpR family DNA-binding transcription regulator [Thioclava dalianensis]KEP67886.1 DeoR faimly transcriptional regulator [Thioclava dalianensis]SFN82063.1 transcriptional regulator, DeoR family [Thioclava dalianensis]
MDARVKNEGTRLRKRDRREQILFELKLRPHLRISELAEQFAVSTETIRRDFDALAEKGLIDRAHGGASRPHPGQYPTLNERERNQFQERERIGRLAAEWIAPGETLMIDAGSTTQQMARFLAMAGTPCRVLTNSLPIAMLLGGSGAAEVILAPGRYLPTESAVVGEETLEFLARHHVERAVIGATALSRDGVSESVPGFAAIKRVMLAQAKTGMLLILGSKFGVHGFTRAATLGALTSVVADSAPPADLEEALRDNDVEVLLAK